MCMIFGVTGRRFPASVLAPHFNLSRSRGPDMAKLLPAGPCWLGFQRLSIMDLSPAGMQPFELDGDWVVCNGEIYGFRAIRRELSGAYRFSSQSDCEILLPLYREYGTEMFSRLGSEFALLLYDHRRDSLIAARDPLGIRPLYYGSDRFGETMFASEPKVLVGLCDHIRPFPPGHYWIDGSFHRYIDLKYAQEAAEFIGAEHTAFTMTREDVLEALPEVIRILGTWDITTIRASIGMYLCCKKIRETTDLRVLMTGEISDELFGYKYTDFAPNEAAFQAEAKKRIDEIHTYDVLRADRCISVNSMEGRVPFGDTELVRYVMSLDPGLKMNRYGIGKYLLRHAFEGQDLLPDSILWREKAAFSDAVGHSMVDELKAFAESRYTDEEYERKRKEYSHGTPFTKESLLYRELFERYYPGQGELIPAFWMPNPSWTGCDVSDPSARVLANYGESGH